MRRHLGVLWVLSPFAAVLLLLTACGSFERGGDGLSNHLTPREARVCRDNVRAELLSHGVTDQWVQRIQYHVTGRNSRYGRGPVSGFEAWVHPRSGGGVIVIELTEFCIVRQIWTRGSRQKIV